MTLTRLTRRLLLLGALIAPALSCVAQQVYMQPQTLLSRDTPVKLHVVTLQPFALGREDVTMVNNKLTVTMRSFDTVAGAGPAPPAFDKSETSADVILGKMPAGNYVVEVLFLNRVTGALTSLGTTQFAVGNDAFATSSAYPAYDFTDLWWNPAESGWGISIFTKREKLFAAWFVYDAAGNPTWYTLQLGTWQNPDKYSGRIFATRAGPNSGVGAMTSLVVTEVGIGTIIFSGYEQAVFTFTVNGIQNSKNIMRQVF